MIIEVVYGVGENNILEKNLMSLFTSEMFRLPPLTYLIWRWTWPYSSRQYCRERAAGRGGEKSGLLCKCVVSIHSTQNGACLTLLGAPSMENTCTHSQWMPPSPSPVHTQCLIKSNFLNFHPDFPLKIQRTELPLFTSPSLGWLCQHVLHL